MRDGVGLAGISAGGRSSGSRLANRRRGPGRRLDHLRAAVRRDDAGRDDLWQYLRRVDGQPLATQAPMTVSVRAVLPNDHNGELEEFALPPRPAVLPYGMLLVAVMVVWLVPEGWIPIRRVRRRRRCRRRLRPRARCWPTNSTRWSRRLSRANSPPAAKRGWSFCSWPIGASVST